MIGPLKKALVQYVETHDGALPADVTTLAPFMESSITPAMLARYEMLRDGKLMSVPFSDWLLTERAPLDEEFDTRVFISINNRGTEDFTNVSRPELQKALRTFMSAHSDQPPASSEQLLPYFQNPLGPLTSAAFLKKYPTGLSPSDLNKFLTPR